MKYILRNIYLRHRNGRWFYDKYKCYSTINDDNVELVKNISQKRAEWERLKKDKDDSISISDRYEYHSGFGKPLSSKSKIGLKFIGKLQSINTNELTELFTDITKNIDEFTPYELIDIGYYLTRINKEGCSLIVEPILHRFFSLPERYTCLNDVIYRVWVYDIAQIIGIKHNHLLMRDIQLIIDDLSLFYDAAAQSCLFSFEKSIINRCNELELYRLPLVIHSLGRCGYNTINVAKAIHNVYINKKGHPDYYLSHLIGLLLKGYCSFHFHPGFQFLNDVWNNIKQQIKTIEFKYVSWFGESFLKLRYMEHVPLVLDELISKHELLSHLEFTDFITNCWSIQSHILRVEYNNLIKLDDIFLPKLDEIYNNINIIYKYYKKLIKLILNEMPNKVYKSTPPYRSTQFELLTRLLIIYPNPRDFRFILPLRKYDPTYPIIEDTNDINEGTLKYLYIDLNHFQSSKYFKVGHLYEDDITQSIINDTNSEIHTTSLHPTPEVTSTSLSLADSSPPEVRPAVSSFNYLSLKSIATPGDRGGEGSDASSIMGMMEDGAKTKTTGPQVEPVADLREAKGKVIKGADGRTISVVEGHHVEWESDGDDTYFTSSEVSMSNVMNEYQEDIHFNDNKKKYNEGSSVVNNGVFKIVDGIKLEPLHDILKCYIHSLFFRTPALAPRGLRLLIQGLVRIHFELREDGGLDDNLLPEMKYKYYDRPLSRAIIREVYRKLACYNTDDLIVSLFGMLRLNIFQLDLSKPLLIQTTDMWLHHKNEGILYKGQLDMIKLFFKTLENVHPTLYQQLNLINIQEIMKE